MLLPLLTLFICISLCQSIQDPKICDGNHFKFISTYALGKQNDLNLVFDKMEPLIHIGEVTYSDEVFRTYKIRNLRTNLTYQDAKQMASVDNVHRLNISGASLKINYTFEWEKKQLTGSINGTGQGLVSTDPISFLKSLDINSTTKQLEWNFVSALPIKITNSLTISKFSPYKVGDYDIINEMLNQLKGGGTTVKSNLIEALNKNFSSFLKVIVHQNNDTWKQPQYVQYSYSDYRGDFSIGYDNFIVSHSLDQGLQLMLSQTARNDSKFECGAKVPDVPDDQKQWGGLQQFISNSFIKSTLRYAISKGFLDVVMTQQFWQSPAFQFYAGDLHEVMPSTKNISSLQQISGKCKALDDKALSLEMKSIKAYDVKVNFSCYLEFPNRTTIIELKMVVVYELEPQLLNDHLDFKIKGISGEPLFTQMEGFQIKNMDLARFMVAQTLSMATNSKVLGSGFKTMNRKFPSLAVRKDYLFLYDSSSKAHNFRSKKHTNIE